MDSQQALPFELIDLQQLPIPPAWGLECRQCRYPLGGLPDHRCPECGWTFDPEEIMPSWTRVREPHYTGAERPRPAIGWRCAGCDMSLVGTTSDECPSCGVLNTAETARPAEEWYELTGPLVTDAMLLTLPRLLRELQIPHRATRRDQKVRDLYAGRALEVPRVQVQRDFYFDVLAVVAALREAADEPEWECVCGEHVPANFEVCWNCGRMRG